MLTSFSWLFIDFIRNYNKIEVTGFIQNFSVLVYNYMIEFYDFDLPFTTNMDGYKMHEKMGQKKKQLKNMIKTFTFKVKHEFCFLLLFCLLFYVNCFKPIEKLVHVNNTQISEWKLQACFANCIFVFGCICLYEIYANYLTVLQMQHTKAINLPFTYE